MRIDDCYQVGYVVKTHGLKGEVVIKLDVDYPEDYENMESVLLLQGQLVPFFISAQKLNGDRAIIKFDDVNSIDEAKQLVGNELYLPLSELPEIPDDGYYYHQLLGCSVFHRGQELGTIEELYQPSHQYLAAVRKDEKEILIPIIDEIFVEVQLTEKKVIVELPEGFLEIYQ